MGQIQTTRTVLQITLPTSLSVRIDLILPPKLLNYLMCYVTVYDYRVSAKANPNPIVVLA